MVSAAPTGRQMARGALWMVAARWAMRLLGLLNVALLARMLAPADFGLVALAMVAVDLCITVTDGDIDMALIRARECDDLLLASGWTLKILSGGATSVLIWLAAPALAAFYGEPRLAEILHIAAFRPLILGFEHIGVIHFRRTLSFGQEFTYLFCQKILAIPAGLLLVWQGRDAAALAATGPAAAAITLLLSFLWMRSRPGWSLARWRMIWDFSRWQILFNASRLLGERIDPLVVRLSAGLSETGLYSVGYELALLPTRELMLPAGRALMPSYARLSTQEELRGAFRQVIGLALLGGCAVGVGLSCIADEAVRCLLGDAWRGASGWVRWLGIYGALEALWLMLDPLLIASGRERWLALGNLALAACLLPAIALTAHFAGLAWLPAARILVLAGFLTGVFALLARAGWLSVAELFAASWRPVTSAAVMAAVLWALPGPAEAAFSGSALWLRMIRDIAIGAASYGATVFILWRAAGSPVGAEQGILAIGRVRRRP